MLAGEDLVTDLNDQLVALVVEPPAGMVGIGGGFLQDGVGGYHLARDQVLADAEVLERALGLRAPELVGGTSTSPRLSVSLRTPVASPHRYLHSRFSPFVFPRDRRAHAARATAPASPPV